MHRQTSSPEGSGVSFPDVKVVPQCGHTMLREAVDSLPSSNRRRDSRLRRSCRIGGTSFGDLPVLPSSSRTVLKEVLTNHGQSLPVSFQRRSHSSVTLSPPLPVPT